jgi:hypothetical protein
MEETACSTPAVEEMVSVTRSWLDNTYVNVGRLEDEVKQLKAEAWGARERQLGLEIELTKHAGGRQASGVKDYPETLGGKLWDVMEAIRSAERRISSMDADAWLRLCRVVRHALKGLQEELCSECAHGDLLPLEMRISILQRAVQRLQRRGKE